MLLRLYKRPATNVILAIAVALSVVPTQGSCRCSDCAQIAECTCEACESQTGFQLFATCACCPPCRQIGNSLPHHCPRGDSCPCRIQSRSSQPAVAPRTETAFDSVGSTPIAVVDIDADPSAELRSRRLKDSGQDSPTGDSLDRCISLSRFLL